MINRPLWLSVGFAMVATAYAEERLRIVLPENLNKYWLLADRSITADVPNSGLKLNDPGCVAVSYVIEKNGSTSHAKVQRIVPQSDLGNVAVSVVSNLHYTAASQNAEHNPVFTYLIVPFNLPEATPIIAGDEARVNAERAEIVAACRIDELALTDK